MEQKHLIEACLLLASFLLMEPVTSLAHRVIFHGFGYNIHKSHHAHRSGIFEKNDLYPLISALLTMTVIALGVFVRAFWFLIPVGFGMTLYGVAYFIIHDVAIHHRVKGVRLPMRLFRWHYRAHMFHHLYGTEPYGFVIPVMPRKYRHVSIPPELDPFKTDPEYGKI